MAAVRMSGMKAPIGGCVSEVNRHEYKGGQFVPVHGVFCGASGKKRQRVWDRMPANSRIDLGGCKLYEVFSRSWDNGVERNVRIAVVTANSPAEAVEAVKATGYNLRKNAQFAWYGH